MADEQQVTLIKQGYVVWNEWRMRDLSVEVDLVGADLTGAALCDADLTGAQMRDTDLRLARMVRANLTGAYLAGANLWKALLLGADLTGATCYETLLADLNLSDTLGLESIRHHGPSVVDHRTLERSGPLPLSFLRGCGLPDRLIDYLPSLLNARPSSALA